MRILNNRKAVSTLMALILIICSIVFGALLSYFWVMANFYLEPENTTDIVITNATFPVNHADRFSFTVMNPSHSASSTNITQIYLTVEGNTTMHPVNETYPEDLPIKLERGTSKTIECRKSWGHFAGKTITIHVLATDASGAVQTFQTEFVQLDLSINFDASVSVREFTTTVTNNIDSAINLTLTKVVVSGQTLTNMTRELPINLSAGLPVTFRGFFNWGEDAPYNPEVTVYTAEGYNVTSTANANATMLLLITNVTFNEENSSEISITVDNSRLSSTKVDISNITLAYSNKTDIINARLSDPVLPYELEKNNTVTLKCASSWKNNRDEDLTITVYTKQGFDPSKSSSATTVTTPKPIILKISTLDFNLTNTRYFLANVTNMPSSIQTVTLANATFTHGTKTIKINQTEPMFPISLGINETQPLNCTFDWAEYEGENIAVKIRTSEGFETSLLFTLPTITLQATFNSNMSTQYFSLSVTNKAFTTINITGININGTWINTTLTYPSIPITIEDGNTLLILCPLDWKPLSGKELTILIVTSDGIEVTTKVTVPET